MRATAFRSSEHPLGDTFQQELIKALPPKSIPYSRGALQALATAFGALRTREHPSTMTVRKEGVESPDLEMTFQLNPAILVAVQVRDRVLSLTMSSLLPEQNDLQRASSGRIAKVEVTSQEDESDQLPLSLDGQSDRVTVRLIELLRSHPRLGSLPDSLEQQLRKALLEFGKSDERQRSFEMPDMLWSRLEVRDGKWIVSVHTYEGSIGIEVQLLHRGKTVKELVPQEKREPKEVSKDVSYVKVVLSKWREDSEQSS